MTQLAGLLPAAVQDSGTADFSNDTFWIWLLKAVAIVVFLLTSVLLAIWFERKVVARMQVRPGPNVHGPFGLLQSLADAMKLLVKEDITVKAADKLVYIVAPMIAVFCSLLTYAVIPFGPAVSMFGIVTPLQLTDFPVATLYILACASVGVYGIVLGGWSSGSTYPLLGSVRSTAQVISYELAMGLSLVSVFILAGSMSTSEIVSSQTQVWWFLPLLPAFVIYVISMVGETNRLPFDLPEAEGELVSGYMTEYSSMKFAWFFLAEYINMLNVSAVATTLFFGGWRAPWPISAINDGMFNTGWWPVLWFLAKVWMFMFLFVWIRGSVLRFRYDQFMKIGWKVLIPIALGWVVCVSVVQGVRQFSGLDLRTILFVIAGIVLAGVLVSFLVPEKKDEEPAGPDAPEELDAFAGGFPVPPLPGQVLPPSPRQQRRAAAAGAQAAPESPHETPQVTQEVHGG
jgi:NADH-quinone oxidoreductase subunit H